MTTPTKVHCFFEQSGTFKNEFRKLGIPAEDYDIQNNFGETDHVIDLFAEIEKGYDGKPSVFDEMGGGRLDNGVFPVHYVLRHFTDEHDIRVLPQEPRNDSGSRKLHYQPFERETEIFGVAYEILLHLHRQEVAHGI